ncbi:hypothetical protein IE077_003657 [Cardiosporidium cionae]|uniref:Glucose-methanol-choline oxidoreductase N-terminal domain-containing protein n=1 Tax=Cardiosporidium cionae TaxID=476202 RepID=A0ABQ7J7U2_9APIC|nr:hypothetical protein IE077_003657 [Cardiosporidium cionae]|eukprot:KAF8820035.1 hypothetical protein IE077_003657 [Cardiosporidium cionae]
MMAATFVGNTFYLILAVLLLKPYMQLFSTFCSPNATLLFVRAAETHGLFESSIIGISNTLFPKKAVGTATNKSVSNTGKANTSNTDFYDYIVVGGGAAGCPLAFTLASAGYSTLLIERGSSRSSTSETLDINGAGIGISNGSISQLITTPQGVRTHIANVLGGGTSINIAIFIEELNEYFDYLEKSFPEVSWDAKMVKEAYQWVENKVANIMPQSLPYGKAWQLSLESIGFSPNEDILQGNSSFISPSKQIQLGKMWRAFSLFNSSNNYSRMSADTFLFTENQTYPENLTVILDHTVTKVDFSSGDIPTAECVKYEKSSIYNEVTSNTASSIFGIIQINWKGVLESLFNPIASIQKLFEKKIPPIPKKACIKQGGEIILSAGAVLTPALLFKSGVGPKKQIETLNIPLIKEIPLLGQNFSDRAFIPVGLFFKDDFPKDGLFPPRICQTAALRPFGPNCENYTIGQKNLGCSLVVAEELSGGRVAEGLIYATRFPFPPEWRDHPFVEFLFRVIEDCSHSKEPFGSPLLKTLCPLASPVYKCFQKAAASFYFTSEPKSRGSVSVNSKGEINVNPNYMVNDQDLFDAIRGVSNIVKQINGDSYKDIMQTKTIIDSCPTKIFNGFLDILLNLASFSGAPSVLGLNSNLALREVVAEIESRSKNSSTVPLSSKETFLDRDRENQRRLDELRNRLSDETNVLHSLSSISAKGDKSIPKEKVAISPLNSSSPPHALQLSQRAACQHLPCSFVSSTGVPTEMFSWNDSTYTKTCYASDPCCSFGRGLECSVEESQHTTLLDALRSHNPVLFHLEDTSDIEVQVDAPPKQIKPQEKKLPMDMELLGFLRHLENHVSQSETATPHEMDSSLRSLHARRELLSNLGLGASGNQWAATFPPTLPDPDDPLAVARFVLTYMSSIWHHAGTAAMGDVVDKQFRIKGINNLSIVDASILNQITRMNPTATLLMLGRYAGLTVLQRRNTSDIPLINS